MPKKKSSSQRPPLGHPTDSLKADIQAARNPFASPGDSSPGAENGEEVDIAAELLASLDARDEAEANARAGVVPSKSRDTSSIPSRKGSLSKPPGAPRGAMSPGASSQTSSQSSSGILQGLKGVGEKLLHPGSPSSATSPGQTPSSPQGAASPSGHHGLLGIFQSHKDSSATSPVPPLVGAEAPSSGTDHEAGGKKVGRQKARKMRKEAEAAAERTRIEEELKANGGNVDEADVERRGIQVVVDSLNVDLYEISPDGHCLYSAVADQLNLLGIHSPEGEHHRHLFGRSSRLDYKDTRKSAGQYMKRHKTDFEPFISDADEGLAGIQASDQDKGKRAADERYKAYCDAVESTSVWGGQPEILALSRAFGVPIWVIQADSPIVKVGQEEYGKDNRKVMISYHRKMYGLGEHYNSLRPRKG